MKRSGGFKWKAPGGWLLLAVLSVALTSCLSWFLEKPAVTVREIRLSPRSLLEMNLVLGIDVENPNRLDLTVTSFEYTVHLNNEDIGSGRLEKEIRVPATSTTRVEAPLAATFKNLGASLRTILTREDVPYKIEGKARVKTSLGSLTFTFSREGRLNSKK